MAEKTKQRRRKYRLIKGTGGICVREVEGAAAKALFSEAFVTKVKLLETELGGAKLARIAKVDRSRITRWKKGERPDAENREKINGLDYIITRLHEHLSPGSEDKWLLGFNAYLNNQRPIDLISAGRMAEVIAAIEQSEQGSYA